MSKLKEQLIRTSDKRKEALEAIQYLSIDDYQDEIVRTINQMTDAEVIWWKVEINKELEKRANTRIIKKN